MSTTKEADLPAWKVEWIKALRAHPKNMIAMHVSAVNINKPETFDNYTYVDITRKDAIDFVTRWRGQPFAPHIDRGTLWLMDIRPQAQATGAAA